MRAHISLIGVRASHRGSLDCASTHSGRMYGMLRSAFVMLRPKIACASVAVSQRTTQYSVSSYHEMVHGHEGNFLRLLPNAICAPLHGRSASTSMPPARYSSFAQTLKASSCELTEGFKRKFHVSAFLGVKRLTIKQQELLKQGRTGFLGTPPRGDVPPAPVPENTMNQPGYGKGGGGQAAFTPTKDLVKRKNYFKRCRHFLKVINYEEAKKVSDDRKGVIPAFRVGDVIELTFVTPENNYKVESFKGLVIRR